MSVENRLKERTQGKQQNWYLRGWEYQQVNGRKKLVYVREYYALDLPPQKRRQIKILAAALYVLLAVVYVWFECTLAQGGLVWYAGAPCLLAVIPIFYLALGVWNFVLSEPEFTYRRHYAAFTRMKIGGRFSALLLGLGFLGQLVFVLRYGRALRLAPELIMLFGALISAACSAALAAIQKNIRCRELPARVRPASEKGNDNI